jgi:endonuclease/exonuclease/phosphatase family metal-dependent hydrolase
MLAASYYIPTISPASINVMGLLGIAAPYLFLFNVVFIIFWVFAKKYFYPIVSLSAILISWNVTSKCVAFNINAPYVKSKTEKQFSLLNYNVRLLNFYNWSGRNDTRDSMLSFFKQRNADVLCLQEFYTTSNDSGGVDNIKDIKTLCDYKYIAQCNVSVNNRGKWGSVVFSKFPLLQNTNYSLDSNSRNRMQQCDLLIANDTVSVFNLHLKSNSFTSKEALLIADENNKKVLNDSAIATSQRILAKLNNAFEKRSIEAEEINKIISSCKHKHIACGDLNDLPSSFTYFTTRNKMYDCFLEKGLGLGATYKSIAPTLRIDYILFSEEFHLLEYKKYKVDYSDHFPLESVFEM